MSFSKTKLFETYNFKKFQNLHPIAHLERAKDGMYIQVLKDKLSGDIIFQKNEDFYKVSNQELSCIETIYCFFNEDPKDVILSSCISDKRKDCFNLAQILNWNWNKIRERLDTVKMQFLHYN